MLIAELRRKLSSIDELDAGDLESLGQLRGLLRETKEDLLTADVFGALKYLPRRPYLEMVLETLRQRNSSSRQYQQAWPRIRSSLHDLEFRFWPSYPTPFELACGSTEPDLQLANEQMLLLFEAKLNSAFGDQQLERELAVAATQAEGRDFFLVLVTPGRRPPRFRFGTRRLDAAEYLEAQAKSEELSGEARKCLHEHRHRVLWISWEAIQTSLQQAHRGHCSQHGSQQESVARAADLLGDLRELMRMRQMQPYEGLGQALKDFPRQCESDGLVFFAGTRAANGEKFVPIGTCCRTWRLELESANAKSPLRTGLKFKRSNP